MSCMRDSKPVIVVAEGDERGEDGSGEGGGGSPRQRHSHHPRRRGGHANQGGRWE